MRFTASLFLFLAVFAACRNPSAAPVAAVSTSGEGQELPAGFLDFYEKFHTDSSYQMAHIQISFNQ